MGGGASKNNYSMVTDAKLTMEHYQKVESNTPSRFNKGQSMSSMRVSPDTSHSEKEKSFEQNFSQSNNFTPPNKLKKGKSMATLKSPTPGTTNNNNSNISNNKPLKKGNSERVISLNVRRKSESPHLKKVGQSESGPASFQTPPKANKMTMSARLPWLVKEASISSSSASNRIKYGRIIGRGLMGTVRVCELDTGKFVAVKTITKSYIKRHNDMRHVNAERDILRSMTSPFCIRLFGTFQDAEHIHFVMEYAPGGELFRRITRRQSFPTNVAKFYTSEVFLALDHVHSLGYVFRDLKPENVMLDEYGHCKLIDFGFAMTPDEHTGLCTTQVGTPAYLSPEQLNGKFTKGYSKIVDWWALGIFLYELLTSKTPFCNSFSESAFEIYTRVLNGKIKYPSKKFTPESKALVGSLLHADVKKRLVDPRLIEKHSFFADVDWSAVNNRQVIPPFTPRLPTEATTDVATICHFDDWGPDDKPPSVGSSKQQSLDIDFFNF